LKGGSQEMAAMILMLINFNNDCGIIVKFISKHCSHFVAATFQLYSPGFLRPHHFFTAWLFLSRYILSHIKGINWEYMEVKPSEGN